jgi:SIR2-like domain
LTDIPPDLKSRYEEGRLLPFVGAGVSMSVRWESGEGERRGISWRELVNQAARMLGFEDPDLLRVRGDDLQILEYFRLKHSGQLATLQNWFNIEIHAPDAALLKSPIHAALANLRKCPLFYTTNYDDFLERGLLLHGRLATSIALESNIAELLMKESDSKESYVQVIKFHGDLNNPSRMVLSESDYEKRLRFTDVEDQRLKSDLLGRALLFLGYSFRDWNVSYLFRLVNETFGPLPAAPTGRRAYIAVSDPSDFEYTLFRARNIEVLPIGAMHQADDIAELLLRLAK